MTWLFVNKGVDLIIDRDRAYKSIESIVRREAYVLAFNDCFYFSGLALLLSGLAILFFNKAQDAAGGAY